MYCALNPNFAMHAAGATAFRVDLVETGLVWPALHPSVYASCELDDAWEYSVPAIHG